LEYLQLMMLNLTNLMMNCLNSPWTIVWEVVQLALTLAPLVEQPDLFHLTKIFVTH